MTIAAGGSVEEFQVSYDFMLMRLSPMPSPGPVSERVSDEAAQQPIASLAPLRDAARSSALFAPDAIRIDGDERFTWKTPDGGQIEVSAVANVVSLRMHAHWSHAARLFELALGLWPDLVLLDLQQDQLHDPASFRVAIARNDSELADARARRDAGA
ncbi:hypothetical protein [Scleromatobacter humisilvae]|uniref:Uncharacterized protein n=1 Tax=Scleromatobacter humisilvae TaxID=2897159 RepID=A0A9X1YKA1_9BURK|nr:hypothetical protein [Scleromatobacter humisilvae]MCK9685912.1 hypothetical protein [Scleromatobacter humisilvae]